MVREKINTTNRSNNARLHSTTPIKREDTAAWADIDRVLPHSKVSVPSETNVTNAKEWVDNGSKL